MNDSIRRRDVLLGAFGPLGVGVFGASSLRGEAAPPGEDRVEGRLKVTKLETFLVKPRSLFLKVHTDAGIVGLGEPVLEGRALTCKQAIEEIAP